MIVINHFKNAEEFKTFAAGETIFKAGERDEHMYAVKEGEVDIFFNGILLETIQAGDFFGEKSLVDREPHTTTAIAKVDSKIVVVDEHKFLFLVHETPTFSLQVMRSMAERIRAALRLAVG